MTFFVNSMFLIHLLSGIFLGGAAFMLYWFIAPAVREMGPDGGMFMQVLLGKFKLPTWISVIGIFNIVTGLYLYWIKYGTDTSWIMTSSGLPLFIGMATGVLAWTLATFVFQRPAAKKIVRIGIAIKAADGKASPDQMRAIELAKASMATGTRFTVILITITIIGMSLSLHL